MKEAALYVHIPFCSIKCFYCDFTAFAGQGKQAARYLRALEKEARLMPPRLPETLYIGGGTPSELSSEEIKDLFGLIHRAWPSASFKEITFEANPESLTPDKAEALSAAGVSRLSLGLQTTDDSLLAAIGRKHLYKDFLKVFQHSNSGSVSISVDLMYGLPGQSLSSCLDAVKAVIALGPPHLSLYGLQVEDRTLFAKRAVEPDEDLGREMFQASLDLIAAAGYHHYEISNFALPGHESLHNQAYWRNEEYVGLGCGAASFLDGRRTTNVDRLLPYCDAVEAGRRPIEEDERLEGKAALGESAILGLRLLDGYDVPAETRAAFAPAWDELERRGLVSFSGSRARLTREGVFLANRVFEEFVGPFQASEKSYHTAGT